MRERLTSKSAAEEDKGTGIMNDPYQVNNPEHEKNDPKVDEYAKGDPSAWGEDVNKDLPGGKKDKRDPDTHIPEITAKMAAEAVQAAHKLEEKAVKCIVASQRILPGAEDEIIQHQAADLMHLPDNMVDAMLNRQEELANTIAKAAACMDKKEEDEKDEEKDAAAECKDEKKEDEKKDEKDAGEIPEGLKKFQEAQKAKGGKKDDKKEDKKEDKEDEKDAEDKEDKKEDEKKEDEKEEKDAEDKKDEKEEKKDEEKDAAKEEKEDEKKDEEKDAGVELEASASLLDDIFAGVIASDTKKGAKSLSGLVKKEASESNSDPLAGIWKTDPDISNLFN